ncbi:hypothetical protein BH11PSE11_BH11PSE11_30130 [soil metagenome]
MKTMRSIWCAISISVFLQGCGNVLDSFTVGEWKQVVDVRLPAAEASLDVRQVREGTGATVRQNDLVKIRLRELSASLTSPLTYDLWVFSGNGAEDTFDDSGPDLFLGSGAVRKELVGRKAGEIFSIKSLANAPRGLILRLPFKAIRWPGVQRDFIPPHGATDANKRRASLEFGTQQKLEAEIEIIETCPSQLFVRSGKVTQYGLDLSILGSVAYDTHRYGNLKWWKFESRCPGKANSRIEAGPYYPFFNPVQGPHVLMDFLGSVPRSLNSWPVSDEKFDMWGKVIDK